MATKKKAGYTQGPWTQEAGDHNPGRKVWADGFMTICEVHDHDTPEGAANAHLIASAPELLGALELAEATIVRLERHAPGSANGTLDVVRDAIRKAKGE